MRENKNLLGATLKSEIAMKKLNRKLLNLKKKDDTKQDGGSLDSGQEKDHSLEASRVLAIVNDLLSSTKYVSDTERMQNVFTKALDSFEKAGHDFDILRAFDVDELCRTISGLDVTSHGNDSTHANPKAYFYGSKMLCKEKRWGHIRKKLGDVEVSTEGLIDIRCEDCVDRNVTYELLLRALCCYGWVGDGHVSFSSELRANFYAIQTAMRNKKAFESLMTFTDGTNWEGSYRAVVAMRDKYIALLMKLDEEIADMCRGLKGVTLVDHTKQVYCPGMKIRLTFAEAPATADEALAAADTADKPVRRRDQINQQMKKKIARAHKRNITVNQEEGTTDVSKAVRSDCNKINVGRVGG